MRRCSLSQGALPGTDAANLQEHLRFADVMIVVRANDEINGLQVGLDDMPGMRCSRSTLWRTPAGHLRGRTEAGKSGGGIRCGFAWRTCTALPACRWESQRQVCPTCTRMIGPDRLPRICM